MKIKNLPIGGKVAIGLVVVVALIMALGAIGKGAPAPTAKTAPAATTSTTIAISADCANTARQVGASDTAGPDAAVKACDGLTVGQWRLLAVQTPGLVGGDTDGAAVAAASCHDNASIAGSTLCIQAMAKCSPRTAGAATAWACKTGE